MMILRKLIDHYLSIVLSLCDLCGGSGSEDGVSGGIDRAMLLLIVAHGANLASLVYLVLPPAQLHALAYNLAGKNRIGLYIGAGLLFVPWVLWVRAALGRKEKEARKSDNLFLLVRRWRIPALAYLVLSALGVALALALAVARGR